MIKIFKSLKNNQKNTNNVYAVVNGVSFNLEYVDDNVFSKKVMGEGVAIVPTSSEVCAPCAGVLTTLFPTGHAIGLDTVNLKGKGFTILKKKNQKVGAGEKIIKLDLNYLRNENIDYTIMIVFLDTKGKTLKLEKYGEVTAGKSIITVM